MKRVIDKILIPVIGLVLLSCSGEVIRRSSDGRRPRHVSVKEHSGIRKKVVLLDFFNEAPYGGNDLGVTASKEMKMELARTGEFIIDETLGVKFFGSSKEIYASGGVKLAQMARKAKKMGVNFVLFGRIVEARVREKADEIGVVRKIKSYSEAKIEIRMFDVNSSKEIYTNTLRGYADDSTYRVFTSDREDSLRYRQDLLRYSVKVAIRRSIPTIKGVAAKLAWTGRVAKIIGNNIYINAGRSSGLYIGDILKVITEGAEIFDPETGALIGVSRGEVKGTIEVIDYFGKDGAIAILHSGGSVQEGDFVQLY